MSSRRLECPRLIDIEMENLGWASMSNFMERFPEAAAYAVINVRPQAIDALGDEDLLIED